MSKKLQVLLVGLLLGILSIGNVALAQSPDWNPNSPCPSGTGPGGITARLYEPALLTQEQRQWLWNAFGGSPNEVAPVGYGGHHCGGGDPGNVQTQTFAQICRQHEHERGPQGVRMGSYIPQDLTSSQRQWLWSNFYPNQAGSTPATGWGGEFCPWQNGIYYSNPNQNQGNSDNSGGSGNSGSGASQSSGSNGLSWTQVRETTNGGIHVSIYCEITNHGSGNITVSEGNANSWQCSDDSYVDFEYACQMAWGSEYHAYIADSSNIYAWRCTTGSSSGNSSTNTSGGFSASPANSTCGNLPEPNVSVGQRARVALYPPYANNVRSGAGTNYSLVTQLEPGVEFNIVGGPVCANGFRWWEISTGFQIRGWTPDGDLNNRWIEPVYTSTTTTNVSVRVQIDECQVNAWIDWWLDDPTNLLLLQPQAPNWFMAFISDFFGVVGNIAQSLDGPPDSAYWRYMYNPNTGVYSLDTVWVNNDVEIVNQTWILSPEAGNPCLTQNLLVPLRDRISTQQ